ncbi:type II secretion system F family protein (plasmid) [Streptomyces sp. NBC_00445]|uniref:type II secretion system F family protein n=1 Tax=Streptomyces sp. NBC_00445 TaxID=2975745 RepID=UPI002E1D1106
MILDRNALLAAAAAVAVVAGLFLAAAGLLGWADRPARRRSRAGQRLRAVVGIGGGNNGPAQWWARASTRFTAAFVAALLVWLFTGWPMGGLATALAVSALPWLLNSGAGAARDISRLEAVEEWVRRLSDIHTVGVSLEQSIQRSLQTVPTGIKEEVTRLVSRMSAGWLPQDAYRVFADELNDATADEVVALLILHIEDRGAGLSHALNDLASGLAQEVLARREIEADRQKPRTNDRWVTIFCLMIFGLSMLSGAYTEPYTTFTGQIVLIGLGVAFVAVKIWMRRMALIEPTPRFLSAADRAGSESALQETS